MTALVNRVVRQHGFLVAAGCGIVVLVVLVVQDLAAGFFGQFGSVRGVSGLHELPLPQHVLLDVLNFVPFSVGVLLCLWFIAPISSELRVAHVVTRSLLAAAVGTVVTFVVVLVAQFVPIVTAGLSGLAFDSSTGGSALHAVATAVGLASPGFFTQAPLVILVGILLWIWTERHPAKHPVSGMLDQV